MELRGIRTEEARSAGLSVALAGGSVLRGKILGGVDLLDVMIARSQTAVKRSKDTVSKHFRLGLNPILQGLAFLLAASFIELLGARTHLSLYQLHHQGLLFLSTCFDVHC